MARRKTLKDLGEQRIATAYAVQHSGQATVDEIHTTVVEGKLREMGVILSKRAITEAAESLQKQGILARNHVPREGSLVKEDAYSMVRMAWTKPPEVARYTTLFPVLVRTTEIDELKQGLDKYEKPDGKGLKAPGSTGVTYKEFKSFHVTIETTTPLLASQPVAGNPALRAAVDASPHKVHLKVQGTGKNAKVTTPSGDEYDPKHVYRLQDGDVEEGIYPSLCFERDALGRIYLHRMCIAGPINLTLYRFGKGNFGRTYIGCEGASFVPHVLTVNQKPIVHYDKGTLKAAGMNTYETVPRGQKIEFMLSLPCKGGFLKGGKEGIEQWIDILQQTGTTPVRGISPARGSEGCGSFKLLAFRPIEDKRASTVDTSPYVLNDNGSSSEVPEHTPVEMAEA